MIGGAEAGDGRRRPSAGTGASESNDKTRAVGRAFPSQSVRRLSPFACSFACSFASSADLTGAALQFDFDRRNLLDLDPATTAGVCSLQSAPSPHTHAMPVSDRNPQTLYDKVLSHHVVDEKLDGTLLLYIGASGPSCCALLLPCSMLTWTLQTDTWSTR